MWPTLLMGLASEPGRILCLYLCPFKVSARDLRSQKRNENNCGQSDKKGTPVTGPGCGHMARGEDKMGQRPKEACHLPEKEKKRAA